MRNSVNVPASERGTFSVYTEAEIVAAYGSMIVNCQGVAAKRTYLTNHQGSDIYQNDKWTFHGSFPEMMQYFTERGQLHGVIADGGGENFATMVAYPRRAAAISASDYLQVTFEVNTQTTARRYAATDNPRSFFAPTAACKLVTATIPARG